MRAPRSQPFETRVRTPRAVFTQPKFPCCYASANPAPSAAAAKASATLCACGLHALGPSGVEARLRRTPVAGRLEDSSRLCRGPLATPASVASRANNVASLSRRPVARVCARRRAGSHWGSAQQLVAPDAWLLRGPAAEPPRALRNHGSAVPRRTSCRLLLSVTSLGGIRERE